MMVQLSCCSGNNDYGSEHAKFLTVSCMYACNFFKLTNIRKIRSEACIYKTISNTFVRDTTEGTPIDHHQMACIAARSH